MRNPLSFPRCVLGSLLLLAAFGPGARAAGYTWDANAGTTGAQDGAGTWNTTNTTWWDGTTNLAWPNTGTDTALFGSGGAGGTVTVGTVSAGAITFNSGTSASYTLSGGTITLGGATPTITGSAAATINSVLAGAAGLQYAGNQNITLGGANTYSGITTVGGTGRLVLNNANALGATGAGNGTVVNAGGTLALALNTTYAAEDVVLNGTGTGNAGAMRISIGSTIWTGTITLGSNASVVGAGSSTTIQGGIDLAGHVLTRTGIGTNLGDLWSGVVSDSAASAGAGIVVDDSTSVTMTNANTYGGTTQIQKGGKLTVSNTTATASGNQTVANNGLGTSTVKLTGASGTPTLALKNNGDGTTAAQTLTYGNAVTIDATAGATVDVGNTNGTTTANNSTATTGATAANKTLALGTLTVSTAGAISATGSSGYAVQFGATTLAANATFNPTTANMTLGAVGQSGGARSLTKTGSGVLALSGTNSYTGATTVSAGTLLVNGMPPPPSAPSRWPPAPPSAAPAPSAARPR